MKLTEGHRASSSPVWTDALPLCVVAIVTEHLKVRRVTVLSKPTEYVRVDRLAVFPSASVHMVDTQEHDLRLATACALSAVVRYGV